MDQPASPRRIVRFGSFQCDMRAGELHKNGIKVKIPDQPFRLLAALLERPGELLTRQEIAQRLWPEQTQSDLGDSLNTTVNKLRAALDDEAENPRFIQTIPRRGYRFIGSVEPQNGDRAGGASADQKVPAVRPAAREQFSSWPARTLVGVAAAGAIVIWWYTPLPPPRITQVDQITLSGRIDTPTRPVASSKQVFYMERDGDHWNLMRTSIGGGDGEKIEVPATSAMALDISPDDSTLLYGGFERRGDNSELWTMPVEGGTAKRLGNRTATGAAYSPDGKLIAFTHGTALLLMHADGTNARKLADLAGPPSWVAWSPDGQRLRFTMNPLFAGEQNSLWEISSDGKNLHQLLAGWSHPASECCGSWTPDGRYFIFTSAHSGTMNLWALRERGSMHRRSPQGPFQLTFGPNTPLNGVPGRGGNHIFFYNGVWRQEMERLDLKTKQISPFLSSPYVDLESYSRDGVWISYVDSQSGRLLRSRADGTEAIELALAKLSPSFPRWSPDGKWVAFGGDVPGHPGAVYVVSANGGNPEPLIQSNTETSDADWSNDGTKLVLTQTAMPPDSAGYELFYVDFATRKAQKIPGSEHLAMSRWSPDGRLISATSDDQSQLKLLDVSTGKWSVIARGTALGISVWSPDSRYLYFQDLLGKGEPLSRYDIQSGRIELLMDFSETLKSGVDRCALFSITPNGSPIIGLSRGAYDLFAATITLP
jgi:Tol biopolymer transport system component/DNA-binding winged helix-turn-helix (wHTH) protein